MPEIGALLRDAVPPDDGEPDLDEIAHLAGRRRRRRTARAVLPLAVLAIVAAGLVVIDGDPSPPDVRGDDVVTGGGTVTRPQPATPAAGEFARLLGTRPITAMTQYVTWPLTPDQFFDLPPDQAVVGTLAEVRPGPPRQGVLCADGPDVGGCVDTQNLETVVEVERWLGSGGHAAGSLAVPWDLATMPLGAGGREAENANRLAAIPYQQAAPLGARVLVLLREADDDRYAWVPSAVSAIVIEDGDGVAVPHARDFLQPLDFDDYVAEVEQRLDQQPG